MMPWFFREEPGEGGHSDLPKVTQKQQQIQHQPCVPSSTSPCGHKATKMCKPRVIGTEELIPSRSRQGWRLGGPSSLDPELVFVGLK